MCVILMLCVYIIDGVWSSFPLHISLLVCYFPCIDMVSSSVCVWGLCTVCMCSLEVWVWMEGKERGCVCSLGSNVHS